jgi:hypothetical protein
MTPLQLAGIALATGVGWGVVMAFIAFVRDGGEVVLLQAWILVPAWAFGRASGSPRAGALAGFALVTGAVWTYELLPGWGLESALVRAGATPDQLESVSRDFDRDDVVLFSTMLVGALIGLGGSLPARPGPPRQPAPEPHAFTPPVAQSASPPPLWAGFEAPEAPRIDVDPPPPPPPAPPPRSRAQTPWAVAFLVAAVGTDVFLGRAFTMYSEPQDAVAAGFAVLGVGAAFWLARRYGIAMVAAGVILAGGFASVQHEEYENRHQEIAIIR